MNRLEKLTGQKIKNHVEFIESFCVKDFKEEYNSYKGNAYGLANTLLQTAFLRPKLKSKKVSDLFFLLDNSQCLGQEYPCTYLRNLFAELITKMLNP